ncbi:hypothetical protein H2200_003047 [Cladophialophora chaetospira]|uniref:BTB domain-containing protein n=1 Tax=Cladophialophora chaetospira TaxID=386627 RepID=A0AA38XGU1_9EURO|nr:hypothetical protein H2200_003047 [Cladophialophora chaetospira]
MAVIDWLYGWTPGTSVNILGRTIGEWDVHWYKVYHMAERLLLPGLQIFAWSKIKALFNPEEPVRPSNALLCAMMGSQKIMRATSGLTKYIQIYYLHCVSTGLGDQWIKEASESLKASGGGDDDSGTIRRLLGVWSREMNKRDVWEQHPSYWPRFEKLHNIISPKLEEEARAFDEPAAAGRTVTSCKVSRLQMRIRSSWRPSRAQNPDPERWTGLVDRSTNHAHEPTVALLKVKPARPVEDYVSGSSCQPPQAPYGDELIAVVIGAGNSQTEFIMHKDLVCAASKFFRRALVPPFTEHQTGMIKLPEENIECFTAFSDWLYDDFPGKSMAAFLCGNSSHGWQTFWLRVFLFSDRLFIAGLKLCAWLQLKAMFNSRSPLKPSDELMYALHRDNLPSSAVVIRKYVDEHIMYWHTKCRQKGVGSPWPSVKPPAKDISVDNARDIREGNRILTNIAAKVAKSDGKGCRFIHPSKKPEFDRRYFLNVAELEKEARAYDQVA